MKKRILSAFLIISIFILCFPVYAEVISTREPTAGDTIYIAGHPDLYPLEYYNEKTACYEGILPCIYEDISRQTGIDFSYVGADRENRQKQLSDNLQVEIVSAYHKGSISPAQEIELFSYDHEGNLQTVCIGFTEIIPADVALAVKDAIQAADKSTWMSAAMELEAKTTPSSVLLWLVIAIGVLVVALILMVVYLCRKRRLRQMQDKTKMTDPLTGIGNTNYFEDGYAHYVTDAMRVLYYVAYIAIDIEKIETYFGQSEAEEAQRYAANTITGMLGDNDFAARIDNGVFTVCFMGVDTERALMKATEMMDALNQYSESYAKENGVLFRCGVYPLTRENAPIETVINYARQGYLSAVSDKQTVCLCDKQVLSRLSLKSRLQKKISTAIANKEFHIYLQFVYDTRNNRLCGAEVLSRWHSMEEGVLSPANYIEDMKLAGMIDRLDFYVFEKTCELLSRWKGTDRESLYVSCNFTRTTLSKDNFSEQFESIISRYEFNRSNLLIELTEDSLVNDSAVAYKNILAIKNLGCRIALDDFGSGYTSFSDLCDYPIDVIKIDRYIVIKAANSRGYAVLMSIIRMAHALGIEVLCEGVETDEQNQKVIDAACDYIQGFHYSRVLPLENALAFYDSKQ